MLKRELFQYKKKFIREIFLILFISILAGFVYNGISEHQIPLIYEPFVIESGDRLTLSQVQIIHKHKEALFIDAREKEEYEAGHIPDAINIPASSGRSKKIELLDQIPKNLQIIVYCDNLQCHFAERLAKEMQYMKFNSVAVFEGGWDAWISMDKPEVVGSDTR